jgi:hypothetical protein
MLPKCTAKHKINVLHEAIVQLKCSPIQIIKLYNTKMFHIAYVFKI